MTHRKALALCATLLIFSGAAQAIDECSFGVNPRTSGFALNPVIDQLIVTSARPAAPGKTCSLKEGDEILQIDQQPVLGQRALKVMRAFNGVKDGAACTLKVRRGDATVIVVTK